MKIKALLVALIFTTAVNPQLRGEDTLGTAHHIFEDFWNDAMETEKTDTNSRETVRQRAAGLAEAVQPLLTAGILEYLNNAAQPSSTALKQKLSEALTAPTVKGRTAEGVADVISSQSGDTFVVVYTVNYCIACSKAWLGEFARQNGKFVLKFSIQNLASDQMVYLARLPVPSEKLTFLLYGVHLGDSHNRLNVQAFTVDETIRLIWSKLDLPQGQISINNSTVTLTYLSSLIPPWNERSEDYAVDEKGSFHLVAEAERPEP
jgi:hypothetical protein